MRLAWTSDLHLVFLTPAPQETSPDLLDWLARLASQPFDALAISGDISEAPCLQQHLALLESFVQRPIYFVLGNHDFYRGSFRDVLPAVRELTARSALLRCLEFQDFIPLTTTTALVGHGCWGDGRYGDFLHSTVVLNDWRVIHELRRWKRGPWSLTCYDECGACEQEALLWPGTADDIDRPAMAAELRRLGEQAAQHIRRVLPPALEARAQVVLLTHTPPFAPQCVPTKVAWDGWAPHAGCLAAAEAIEQIMARYPDRQLLILSGHVHAPSCIQIAQNIEQRTASAQYGHPEIAELIELPLE